MAGDCRHLQQRSRGVVGSSQEVRPTQNGRRTTGLPCSFAVTIGAFLAVTKDANAEALKSLPSLSYDAIAGEAKGNGRRKPCWPFLS